MTWASFRTGARLYQSRPPAKNRAARVAWDEFASRGPVADVWLADGYWMCIRPDGSTDEEEAEWVRDEAANLAILSRADRGLAP